MNSHQKLRDSSHQNNVNDKIIQFHNKLCLIPVSSVQYMTYRHGKWLVDTYKMVHQSRFKDWSVFFFFNLFKIFIR